jgi:hypothetical protein
MMNRSRNAVLPTLLVAMGIGLVSKSSAQGSPTGIDIADAPLPIQILVQSPAETTTDLQLICLFRSSPLNTLHGSLIDMDKKLGGLLDRVRSPDLFRGELGETLANAIGGRFFIARLVISALRIPPLHQPFLTGELRNSRWGGRGGGYQRFLACRCDGEGSSELKRVERPVAYRLDVSCRSEE